MECGCKSKEPDLAPVTKKVETQNTLLIRPCFKDLPKEVKDNGWDLVLDGCNDNTDR